MLLKSGAWVFASAGINQILRLLVVVILARLLTPEAFGIIAISQIIISLSQVVATFGIGSSLIKSEKLSPNIEGAALSIMLIISFFIVIILMGARNGLSELLNVPELIEIMPIILISFIASAAANPGRSLLVREMKYKLLAGIDIWSYVFGYMSVSVILALNGMSYMSLIYGILAQSFIQLACIFLYKPIKPNLALKNEAVASLFHFGGGVFLTEILSSISQKIDNIIVSIVFGVNTLGFYSRAFTLLDIVNNLFGKTFKIVLFSGASKAKRSNLESNNSSLFLSAYSFAALLILPFAILIYFLSGELISILLGPQWEPSVEILKILSIAVPLRLYYKVSGAFIMAEGRVYELAFKHLIFTFLIGGGAFLGSFYGIKGVAWGIVLALLIQNIQITRLAMICCEVKWLDLINKLFPYHISAFLSLVVVELLVGWERWGGEIIFVIITSFLFLLSYILILLFVFKGNIIYINNILKMKSRLDGSRM